MRRWICGLYGKDGVIEWTRICRMSVRFMGAFLHMKKKNKIPMVVSKLSDGVSVCELRIFWRRVMRSGAQACVGFHVPFELVDKPSHLESTKSKAAQVMSRSTV